MLSYIELGDALYLNNSKDYDKAHGAILRAQHYLIDAIDFSQIPHILEQKMILNEIIDLNNEILEDEEISSAMEKVKQLI